MHCSTYVKWLLQMQACWLCISYFFISLTQYFDKVLQDNASCLRVLVIIIHVVSILNLLILEKMIYLIIITRPKLLVLCKIWIKNAYYMFTWKWDNQKTYYFNSSSLLIIFNSSFSMINLTKIQNSLFWNASCTTVWHTTIHAYYSRLALIWEKRT